jgi:uncharacterized BrkB/YihY/UPF0761 family membrane protein
MPTKKPHLAFMAAALVLLALPLLAMMALSAIAMIAASAAASPDAPENLPALTVVMMVGAIVVVFALVLAGVTLLIRRLSRGERA